MRKKLMIGGVVSVLALVILFWWPDAGYDLSRVHPRLRELKTPYQSVETAFFLDGGSIGIIIIDRDSRRLELALPVSAGSPNCYQSLFTGAVHTNKAVTVEIPFSDDTRRMLISLIEQHRKPTDDSDSALLALRGAPRDHARFFFHNSAIFVRGLLP